MSKYCIDCVHSRRIGKTEMLRCIAPVPIYYGTKSDLVLNIDTDATYCEVFCLRRPESDCKNGDDVAR